MSLQMQVRFASLLLAAQIFETEAWKCGIGPVSSAISYMIAFPSDVVGVDRCCIEHDALVDGLHLDREEADRIFCQCLESSDSWYVRNIVKPLFCTSVRLYTKWIDRTTREESTVTIPPADQPQQQVEASHIENLRRM
ncbi:unnamed protein product [Cylicocyclus nassatus]|uniref:Uncharacterized protein n=1 Tax=Cylicocyclus nassatus TaxID=53992 RepID=A0AA36HEB6_CYLNA|nr:unnamed protein product [Cylicocyclus nassatus]